MNESLCPASVGNGGGVKTFSRILARQARLEEESLALSREIGSLKEQYGTAMIDMTSMQAYLKSLLGNKAVAKYLRELHCPIHDKFKEIAVNGNRILTQFTV